jgi:hypothetical protein
MFKWKINLQYYHPGLWWSATGKLGVVLTHQSCRVSLMVMRRVCLVCVVCLCKLAGFI